MESSYPEFSISTLKMTFKLNYELKTLIFGLSRVLRGKFTRRVGESQDHENSWGQTYTHKPQSDRADFFKSDFPKNTNASKKPDFLKLDFRLLYDVSRLDFVTHSQNYGLSESTHRRLTEYKLFMTIAHLWSEILPLRSYIRFRLSHLLLKSLPKKASDFFRRSSSGN